MNIVFLFLNYTVKPLMPGGNKRPYILKKDCS